MEVKFMDVGKDLTDVAAQITAELGRETIKAVGTITGKSAQIVLETLIEHIKKRYSMDKPGETNLKKLLHSNKNLKMVDMETKDVEIFAEKAQKFGLTYAVVSDDNKSHIIFKDENSDFIRRIFEIMIDKKLINKPKDYDQQNNKTQDTKEPEDKSPAQATDEKEKQLDLEKNNLEKTAPEQNAENKVTANEAPDKTDPVGESSTLTDKTESTIRTTKIDMATTEEKNENLTTLDKDEKAVKENKVAKTPTMADVSKPELIKSSDKKVKKAKSSAKDFAR